MLKTASKMIAFVLLFLSVAPAVPAQASGATYYVAPEGDDGNNGTSPSTPWKTLDKVNTVGNFNNGDRILFKRGGVWTGQLHPKGSGTAAAPNIIDAYGTGNLPVINGAGVSNGAVRLYNQQYWEINNLEVTNTGSAPGKRIGVSIEARNAGQLNHIYVSGLYVHDVDGWVTSGTEDPHWNGGIGVVVHADDSPTTSTWFNDVVIENNTVADVARTGIFTFNEEEWNHGISPEAHHFLTGVVIRNNTVTRAAGDSILSAGAEGVLIERNVSSYASMSNDNCNAAIWVIHARNPVLQYNEAYATQPDNQCDGQGFDLDGGVTDGIVQYNYSHDNYGGMLLIMPAYTGVANSTVRYNISQNEGSNRGVITMPGYEIGLNTKIYNNTFYLPPGSTTAVISSGPTSGNTNPFEFKNNIVVNYGSGGYEVNGGIYEYNTFYGSPLAPQPADPYKSTANPLLVNAGSGGIGLHTVDGYKLYSGSPALGSGVLIAGNGGKDYWGNSVSSSAAPNRGAYNGPGIPNSNAALGAEVTASSSIEHYGWYKDYATDGNFATGYSSQLGQTADHTEWIELKLAGGIKTFSEVILYPRSDAGMVGQGFPVDFQIQVWNGSTWLTRVTETGYPVPDGTGQAFTWGHSDTTDRIRILATSLREVGSDGYMLQLAEIQVR
ncbi:discoidin domain-containing protein [Paenibacillaceae bacterium WGS1546]|uniref:discoidin domain-containing protein n=1 Tax=Cohnella sp. WGS1546 TaxID=3366810 RepID=UPI00372D0E7D